MIFLNKPIIKNYAYVVRKVYKGSTLKQALHIEGPETEEIFDVAEGDQVCPKCKSRKIIRKEMQTRSADESATVFRLMRRKKN